MDDTSSAYERLARVPVFSDFRQIAEPDLYVPVPDDWVVGLADVVSSTRAIEAGRYKAVNMAGAAVIAAVSNALGRREIPFVFGGDGASFVVPPDWAEAAAAALAATATFAAEEFELDLRVALVPVRAIREAGRDIRIARFQASPDVAYAMFSGGGLIWAEERMKGGGFGVPAAPPGTRPDLTGLSCRFETTPSRRGTILSMIVRPAGERLAEYGALVRDILSLVETSPDMARPMPAGGPALTWPSPSFDLEARSIRRPFGSLTLARLLVLARTFLSRLVFRFRIPVGRFDPTTYLDQLVANTDYRKYDDGLRMTIDCSRDLAAAIESRLDAAREEGIALSGIHRQEAALVTCLTPSIHRSDHVHFVDGAAGGYAAAAAALKG